ncbi:MetQ/NlpA family ABC transporter substrate-binding protein [Pajaroellobacter abortibovis]|uniref:Lipoprotein n=1 Tax=Pajaroellobacter abortibovis TaxID=1882918 RepID=A0A1L6MY53_9BACT|nr:MetQ/NlpA family ABC transporter substrate-binding protein [Pajaroellobacter abortibovis]APS00335.1 hypothetical protein BCY86_06325 [Pajaroellobacter abortibovis]
MRLWPLSIFLLSLIPAWTGCRKMGCLSRQEDSALKVGVMEGPETEVMEIVQQIARTQHQLEIKIVPFTDYTLPNAALADQSIDVNIFQHEPYLQEAITALHYPITAVAKTFIYPMGIYSRKISHLPELHPNATVAIPNDPSNSARALLLLQKAGLVRLKGDLSLRVTLTDILENPFHLRIRELDTATLPRVLEDSTLVVINTNYAILANLYPTQDALFIEDKESPYANLIVVRTDRQTDPRIALLIQSFHSPEVVQAAERIFAGLAIPAW